MAGLTVGMLRDMLATLDADMPVRLTMNWEYDSVVGAVYISGGDTLYLDDVPMDGTGDSVLYNAD
jgi:hypothetical protein